MVDYVTFEDIQAANEADYPVRSLGGKTIRVATRDPLMLFDELAKIEEYAKSQDATAAKLMIGLMRNVVKEQTVVPAMTVEHVQKTPQPVLVEMFDIVVSHSGAGPGTQAEAETFRQAPSGADGSAVVQ